MPRRKGLFGILDQISSRASRLATTILETVQAPAPTVKAAPAKPAPTPKASPAPPKASPAPTPKASPAPPKASPAPPKASPAPPPKATPKKPDLPAKAEPARPPAKKALTSGGAKPEKIKPVKAAKPRPISKKSRPKRSSSIEAVPAPATEPVRVPAGRRLLDVFLEQEETKLVDATQATRRGALEALLVVEQEKEKAKTKPKAKPKAKPKSKPRLGRLEELLAQEQAELRKPRPEKPPKPIEVLSEKQAARLAPRNPHVQDLLKQLSAITQTLDGLGYGQESREVLKKAVQPEVPEVPQISAPPLTPLAPISPLPQVSRQPIEAQVQAPEEKKAAPQKRGCPPNPEEGYGGGSLTLNAWMAQHGITDSRDVCWPRAAGEPYPGRYVWAPLRDDGTGPWMWREAIVAPRPRPPKAPLPEEPPPPKPAPAPPPPPAEYDLEGAGFFVPFQRDPKEAYRFLMDAWHRAGVGQVRAVPMAGEVDELGRPRGESLGTQRFDPIVRIEAKSLPGQLLVPQEAIQSEEAFLSFLAGWKVTGGVQLRVENMILRGASRNTKRVFVPPAIRVTNMGGKQPYESKKKSKG